MLGPARPRQYVRSSGIDRETAPETVKTGRSRRNHRPMAEPLRSGVCRGETPRRLTMGDSCANPNTHPRAGGGNEPRDRGEARRSTGARIGVELGLGDGRNQPSAGPGVRPSGADGVLDLGPESALLEGVRFLPLERVRGGVVPPAPPAAVLGASLTRRGAVEVGGVLRLRTAVRSQLARLRVDAAEDDSRRRLEVGVPALPA